MLCSTKCWRIPQTVHALHMLRLSRILFHMTIMQFWIIESIFHQNTKEFLFVWPVPCADTLNCSECMLIVFYLLDTICFYFLVKFSGCESFVKIFKVLGRFVTVILKYIIKFVKAQEHDLLPNETARAALPSQNDFLYKSAASTGKCFMTL